MHPSDEVALNSLQTIPGFSQLLKAFMSVWNERQLAIMNMSSKIRVLDGLVTADSMYFYSEVAVSIVNH